jgi:hypothetical protein
MNRAIFFATPILTVLAAGPSYAATKHDVPWYVANRAALQSELAACTANPGDLANTPDCTNAESAQKRVAIGAL